MHRLRFQRRAATPGHRALLAQKISTDFAAARGGPGKTTSLNVINLLLAQSEGTVLVDGRSTEEWDVIQLRRSIGYAIQEAGLFPHYTVQKNVALVPRLEHWDQARIAARVKEVLQLVGLPYDQFAG